MLAKFLAYVLSAVLFVHSSYSAYEYSLFKKHLPLDSTYNDLGLPVDIKIEACIGVVLACAGAIISSWNSLTPIKFSKAVTKDEVKGQGPFIALENRAVFQDIRSKRLEYLQWAEKNKVSN